MDNHPFLPKKHTPEIQIRNHLSSLPEHEEIGIPLSPALKEILIFGDRNNPPPDFCSEASEEAEDLLHPLIDHPTDKANLSKKHTLHRSKTAPAMAVMRDGKPEIQKPHFGSFSIVKQAVVLLFLYLSLGVLIYAFNRDHFSGNETHPVIDALYFCIVTMCTIGYGDITPQTDLTKLFACLFVLVGFGFIDILLSGMVSYVLDLQENLLLSNVRGRRETGVARSYIVDVEKGRMRIRMKVALALGVVVLCIGVGTGVLHLIEQLGWLDSFYLSVMSVTTVGYGDRAFTTLPGRLFASVWLLVSTLAVARAFLYLAEWRIDKRHRRVANWVLHRDMTVDDLLAADVNQHGFVRKKIS
ncbi:two-pore potassium channel 3 isoform X2 [Amborella trichopoda]|uniref:two-pore potassium channel 3 isoform X2 n=1 Tax=Amborella trichopoda TaxID=13333 RepID=UPI0009C19025|nr:two-pore potassium channel 3 isoform X2 [Amborella trichopoda]|eukprot:XP_020520532.1 two-pore potassium channel 3 isoform X2 [Amborella trichopoda]